MTQFEIIMRTDTPELPAEIGNFEEVKAAISEALTQYNVDGVAVTSETVKDAEKVRASLRKAKEQIETYRKDAKSAYLGKFAMLEAQCKELSALIDAPITAIDAQIKAFEEAESVKKYDEIMIFFVKLKHPEWLALSDVLNPKWKNKGLTLEKLYDEIRDAVKTVETEYSEIKGLYGESDLWTAIQQKFTETKSKSQTLVYAAQIERQHSEEQKRAESIQNARRAQEDANAVSLQETEQNATQSTPDGLNAMISGKFAVTGTREQIKALARFMKDTGIQYQVIKN